MSVHIVLMRVLASQYLFDKCAHLDLISAIMAVACSDDSKTGLGSINGLLYAEKPMSLCFSNNGNNLRLNAKCCQCQWLRSLLFSFSETRLGKYEAMGWCWLRAEILLQSNII